MATDDSVYHNLVLQPSSFSIRLLTIAPGSGTDPITCRLRVAKVHGGTPYEALSYTSADAKLRYGLKVSSHTLTITSNLQGALRHHCKADEKRTIWDVAVCINQNDLAERETYVRGMGYIYRNAQRVIIWMGERDAQTVAAFRYLKHEIYRPDNNDVIELSRYSPPTWHGKLELSKKIETYVHTRGSIDSGILNILERSWWRRVWVVQEVCMAAGNSKVVSGDSSMQWNNFIAAIETCGIHQKRWYAYELYELRSRAGTPPRLRSLTAMNLDASLLEDELHWLRYTATFKASDPRDKLYALLGMTRGLLGARIQVDYTISAADLMEGLMLKRINTYQNLNLSPLYNPEDGRAGRPSSLPDLSVTIYPALPTIQCLCPAAESHSTDNSTHGTVRGISTSLIRLGIRNSMSGTIFSVDSSGHWLKRQSSTLGRVAKYRMTGHDDMAEARTSQEASEQLFTFDFCHHWLTETGARSAGPRPEALTLENLRWQIYLFDRLRGRILAPEDLGDPFQLPSMADDDLTKRSG